MQEPSTSEAEEIISTSKKIGVRHWHSSMAPSNKMNECHQNLYSSSTTFKRKTNILTKFIYIFTILAILMPSASMAFGGGHSSSSDYDIFRYKCPDGCMCVPDVVDGNQLVISCETDSLKGAKTFEDFPRNATKTLSLRCLSHQHESTFADDMFEGFKTLRDLKISNCHGTDLPANTFRGLLKLEYLYLSELSMEKAAKPLTISSQLFHPIKALQKLTLTGSAIRDFPDGLFCPLTDLKILNLTTNNLSSTKLEQSQEKCELNQLIILDLSGNVIESIGPNDLTRYPFLRQFFLIGNAISDIHEDAFKSLPSLQHLDFEDNELKEVIVLPESLLHLNLARNKLANIPASVANLRKLVYANFSNNKIDSNTPFSLQSETLETFDLSYNNLDSVPLKIIQSSYSSLLSLHLSNNQIAVLQPSQFQNLTKLSKLDLSNNRIKTLTEGCFDGLTELQELSLRNNSIYHIDVGVFGDISHRLHKLDMSKNLLVELPMAVARLAKIKTMDFSENQINKLYKFVLNKMVHLSKLDLSSNRLSSIDSYIFSSCGHLSELNLSNNRIDGLAQDAFEACPHFRSLDLSRNKISIFSGSLNSVKSLRSLNISNNNIQTFEWSEFPDDLQIMDASNNKISAISPATNSKLKVFKLNNNRLKQLQNGQLSDQIEDIDISNNKLEAIEVEIFSNLINLKQVNLKNNKLQYLSKKTFRDSEASMVNGLLTTKVWLEGNPFQCHCEMSWITLLSQKTTLQIVDSDSTTCKHMVYKNLDKQLSTALESDFLCPYEQTCEPSCICCQYGNCDCKSKCPEGCSCFHDQAYKTNVVECKGLNETSSRAFSPKLLPMHATHILLENLQLPTLKTHDFMSRTKLVELRINASGVRIIQPLTFNTLHSLKKLDLSGNELTELRGDEMFKTQRIEELNLHNNHLYELDTRLVEQLPNLQTLHLAGNDFDELPEMIILSQKLTDVTLAKNPFRCDCNWRRFRVQSWLVSNIAIVKDANLIECAENVTKSFLTNDTTVLTSLVPNRGDHIFAIPMLDFINQANNTFCAVEVSGFFGGGPERNIILMIVSAIVMFLALIGLIYIVISIFRKSKNPKNRYKKAPPSLNCSTTTPGCSPLPLIQYDAFLSYSKADESTILNNLCRPLENEDYTLCLLHQDGAKHAYTGNRHAISDELIDQLDAFQSLIMFVTKNFLENEWSTLQIKTSHQLFAKSNKRIIGILDENVKANELDNELGQILRKNNCIRSNDAIFWKLLFASMPQKLHLQNSSGSTMLGDGSDIYSEAYGSIVPSEVV
jgi:Leucine-rich repeat (LRR) protein